MVEPAETLQVAIAHHRRGQLAEAEQLYRQILNANPRHADALHLLGLIAHQAGRHDIGVQYIRQAISVEGNNPLYHCNLGEAYRALSRTPEARASYLRALHLNPALAQAHYNLGLLAQQSGQSQEAQQHYEQAIRQQPNYAQAHNNLGNLLRSQGKLNEALAAYQAALKCQPDYVEALNNLGATLVDMQRLPEAVECLQRALRLRPDSAEAYNHLGNAYARAANWTQAAQCFESALTIRPEFIDPRYNLGKVLQIEGKDAQAAEVFFEVLRRDPDHFDAHLSYRKLLERRGAPADVLAAYDRTLQQDPSDAMAHFFRAGLLMSQGKYAEAIDGFKECIRLQPQYLQAYLEIAVAFNTMMEPDGALEYGLRGLKLSPTSAGLCGNMAAALQSQGRGEEAISWFRKSLEYRPNNSPGHSNMLYAMNFVPSLAPAMVFSEHLQWATLYAEPLTVRSKPHENDRTPGRRLRVGYVSPHFFDHAVNFFTEPILASHDHDQFEIFCYSAVRNPDAVTLRLRSTADQWREINDIHDEEVARMIRDDQIDILVDLAGHIGRNRLLVFARKPAPIQVTYIGYQNTTGMSAMDYRLTDDRADPVGLTDAFYTEKLVRLPRSFFCYRPPDNAPPITPLPALERGFVTFGSFNNYAKVAPEVIDAWLRILARVPNSRLSVLAYTGGYVEHNFKRLADKRGINPERIQVVGRRFRREYLQLIADSDIALDPFPFNGHTTTCDAVWMGVPVVMQQGQTYASRFGGSVLANVGLERLIGHSTDEYIHLAVDLATDLPLLAQLRSELRPRMAASVLLDYQGFTRNLEQAYRQMWEKWREQGSK